MNIQKTSFAVTRLDVGMSTSYDFVDGATAIRICIGNGTPRLQWSNGAGYKRASKANVGEVINEAIFIARNNIIELETAIAELEKLKEEMEAE